MKHKFFGFLLLVCLAVMAFAAIPPIPTVPTSYVTLSWKHPDGYPNGNTNWVYRIYRAGGMETNWSVVATVPGTATNISFPLQRGEWFFYATVYDPSNFWLESDPTAAVWTDKPLPSGKDLAISPGLRK